MQEFNILLIDDDKHDGFLFKKNLLKSGIKAKVLWVDDGPAGLDEISKNNFDCIFLDYNLPKINGLELLKKIRTQTLDTPVIMLTGQQDHQIAVEFMKEGAGDYISKDSLSPEALRISIENADKIYKIKKEKSFAEEALKRSQASLSEAQHIARLGNWEYDLINKSSLFSDEASNILEVDLNKKGLNFFHFISRVNQEDHFLIKECIENLKKNLFYDVTFRMYSYDNTCKYINAKGHIIRENDIKKIVGTIQDVTILKNAINDKRKATAKSRATTIVFSVAIILFLISEAILDPFIDSMTASLLIALSFKGSIALVLKPVEGFMARIMLGKIM